MKWETRWPIRTRLRLLLLALALPFLFYLALSTWLQIEQEHERAQKEMLDLARLTAARLDDHIDHLQQLLSLLSNAVGPLPEDIVHNQVLLNGLAAKLPAHFNNLSVWTADGKSIGAMRPLLRPQSADVTHRRYFQQALRGPGLAIEAPMNSLTNGELVGLVGLPIERDGRVVGVVAASTRLTALQSLLAPPNMLPKGAVMTISDIGGVVLARSIDPEKWIGKNLLTAGSGGLADSLKRRDGVRDGSSADGIDRIAGFTTAKRVPWLVYVGIPTDVALGPLRERLFVNVAVGAVILLIGLGLAGKVAERIASALRRLSEDAAAFERGDMSLRSRVDQGGEIGSLAATLNRAADALLHRTAALQSSRELLARSEERLSLALEGSNLALFDWDIARDRLYHSPQALAMRGYPAKEITTTPATLRQQIHPDDTAAVMARVKAALVGDAERYDAEFRVSTASGGWMWLRAKGRVVQRDANGRAIRLAGTYVDITQRKTSEERMRQLAESDALTGLPNRALFLDRLGQAIARASRSGKPMALLYLDIDHFKMVNDTLGHEAGDDLLKTFAQRMQACVRTSDTVARLGGDEFTVILEGLTNQADAEAVAQTVVAQGVVPVMAGGQSVTVSTSVGIAMVEPGETDAADIMRRADAALYRAKRQGRGRYVI